MQLRRGSGNEIARAAVVLAPVPVPVSVEVAAVVNARVILDTNSSGAERRGAAPEAPMLAMGE